MLGLSGLTRAAQEDEAQHLFDDPNSMHYGSLEQQHI